MLHIGFLLCQMKIDPAYSIIIIGYNIFQVRQFSCCKWIGYPKKDSFFLEFHLKMFSFALDCYKLQLGVIQLC